MSDNAISKQSSPEYQSIANFQVDAYSIRVASLWRDFYTTSMFAYSNCKVPAIHFTDEIKKNQI